MVELLSLSQIVSLGIAFFVTAILYSAAGFGGGSTYSAVLLESPVPTSAVPLVSLPCNIVVAGIGFFRSWRRDLVPGRMLAAVLAVSVPAAYVGGSLPVSRELFLALLALVLLYAGAVSLATGVQMEFPWAIPPLRTRTRGGRRGVEIRDVTAGNGAGEGSRRADPLGGVVVLEASGRAVQAVGWRLLAAAGIIGLVSGLVGIGGGILLSPVLQRERTLAPRRLSALTSGFILFNSISALIGKIGVYVSTPAGPGPSRPGIAGLILVLASVVVIGGRVGSGIAIRELTPGRLRIVTGALLLTVSVRVLL